MLPLAVEPDEASSRLRCEDESRERSCDSDERESDVEEAEEDIDIGAAELDGGSGAIWGACVLCPTAPPDLPSLATLRQKTMQQAD